LINRVIRLLIHYFFLLISLTDLQPLLFAVLANELKVVQKTLSNEKSARLGAENSLAEEKAARQAAEQSLQQSQDANITLSLELENAQTSLAATRDKLDSAEEALKNQRQLLESARKTSSKHESSFNVIISSTVAHAAALFKNYLPELNMELLR
jgi:chromosome segregation ATPase